MVSLIHSWTLGPACPDTRGGGGAPGVRWAAIGEATLHGQPCGVFQEPVATTAGTFCKGCSLKSEIYLSKTPGWCQRWNITTTSRLRSSSPMVDTATGIQKAGPCKHPSTFKLSVWKAHKSSCGPCSVPTTSDAHVALRCSLRFLPRSTGSLDVPTPGMGTDSWGTWTSTGGPWTRACRHAALRA